MAKEKKERAYTPAKVIEELKKVEWPSFKGLMGTSAIVVIFTLLFGVYFFICEFAASGLIQLILNA
ncbi:MAG: preprotein translocase subunit SecE [Holdemanella sp.]|nr:preprotein translocase subunit SecE [Holdemanella sp.]